MLDLFSKCGAAGPGRGIARGSAPEVNVTLWTPGRGRGQAAGAVLERELRVQVLVVGCVALTGSTY